MIRVYLAEDNEFVRMSLNLAFNVLPDILLVGEHEDSITMMESICKADPDVVVLDATSLPLSWVQVARELRHSTPDIAVVVLIGPMDELSVADVLRVGAAKIIPKAAGNESLFRAVREVYQSTTVWQDTVDALERQFAADDFDADSQQIHADSTHHR